MNELLTDKVVSSKHRFVSFEANSQEAQKVLETGQFGPLNASLVSTLNHPGPENYSFELTSPLEVKKPRFWKLWHHVLSLSSLPFVLFPIFIVWTKGVRDNMDLNPFITVLSIIGSLSLYIYFNLKSDILSFGSGLHRYQRWAGNEALTKHWTQVRKFRTLSHLFLFIAFGAGLPVVVASPNLGIFMSLVLAGLTLAWTNLDRKQKNRLISEFVVFMMFGPLLTLGFQSAIQGRLDTELLWIGCLSGLLALFVHTIKNFAQIMEMSKLGLMNATVRLGFEKSKIWISMLLAAVVVSSVSYLAIYASLFWAIVTMVLLGPTAFFFWRNLMSLQSPLNSKIHWLLKMGRMWALGVAIVHTVEALSEAISRL